MAFFLGVSIHLSTRLVNAFLRHFELARGERGKCSGGDAAVYPRGQMRSTLVVMLTRSLISRTSHTSLRFCAEFGKLPLGSHRL
jgi:hypothetical protein